MQTAGCAGRWSGEESGFKSCELGLGIGAHLGKTGGGCRQQDVLGGGQERKAGEPQMTAACG
jgi:hypothetical protein